MMFLLFAQDHEFFGEFLFEAGACQRMTLTSEGTAAYGSTIEQWYVQGISTLGWTVTHDSEGMMRAWMRNRTLLSSPQAQQAFLDWVSFEKLQVMDVPERILSEWQQLCALDLQPSERFAILQSMRHSSHQVLRAWKEALLQA